MFQTQSSGSSAGSSSTSSVLSELLSTGRVSIQPETTRFVCHTSTIPLATTADEQLILGAFDMSKTTEVTHSILHQPGFEVGIDYRCCKKHCMYVNKNGTHSKEILRSNCPCSSVVHTGYDGDQEIDIYLQPLCFLQVLKELRYDFGYRDSSICDSDEECCHNDTTIRKSNRPRISLTDVMFCQNSQSVLDGKYTKPLRNWLGFDGWEAANTPERVGKVLESLYWYRKFCSNHCRKLMEQAAENNFRLFKSVLEQTLHTINGFLCKKFLLLPCEMEGYIQLAKNTNEVFEEFMQDYLRPIKWKQEPTVENSIFLKAKKIFKTVKQRFLSEAYDARISCISLLKGEKSEHCKFAKFWFHAISRLEKRIRVEREVWNTDYTQSLAWLNTMSGIAQTRNLGYLPPWVADVKREEFRATIGRERVKVDRSHLELVRAAVMKRAYEMGVEPDLLDRQGREETDEFKEVINSIRIPLKPTASVATTVFNGGKVEDARQLLQDARRNKWKVPERDLKTGEVKQWLTLPDIDLTDPDAEIPPFEGFLFWISFQIVLNWFASKYRIYAKYLHKLPGSERWTEDLQRMSIVHISEPGKERNLTKTSSVLTWFLTPGSKVSQMALAINQDHRAGLVLSAQDWMHQRRVSSQSFESFWMFDDKTRLLRPDVWNGFQDWTESTDHIKRDIGVMALYAWMDYIKFPPFYKQLICLVVQWDYAVSEYTHTEWVSGIVERHHYNGKVTEGFMMSMPFTKTILHLMHDVNIGVLHIWLYSKGVKVAENPTQTISDIQRFRAGQLRVDPENT